MHWSIDPEILVAITSMLAIWLTAKKNMWCWPVGIISELIKMYVVYREHLQADFILQIAYVMVGIYGWYYWRKVNADETDNIVVRVAGKNIRILCALAVLIIAMVLGTSGYYFNASLPFWDASFAAISLVATWLMAKKYLECWILWVIADICYAVLYGIKGLEFIALLAVIEACLAAYGYTQWRSLMKKA